MADVYYFNTELPIFRERVVVDQRAYFFDFDWNTRLSDWRVTVTPEGSAEPKIVNRRIGGSVPLQLGTSTAMFFGKEPYKQSALRDHVMYMVVATADELRDYTSSLLRDPLPDLV